MEAVLTNFGEGGVFKVAITNTLNEVVYKSPELNAVAGAAVLPITPVNVKMGSTIWIQLNYPTTITARAGFGGGPSNNKLYNRDTNGAMTTGGFGSFYTLAFRLRTKGGGLLGGYIPRSEAEGYSDQGPAETFGSTVATTGLNYQSETAYYILKIPFTSAKTVKKINLASQSTGPITFVIGELDQANKFIELRSFTANIVGGINVIEIDEELKIGQYVGVKTPGNMPRINPTLQNVYTWGVEGSLNQPLVQNNSWSLGMAIEVLERVYNDDALAHMRDIKDVNEKIENLEVSNVWKSPDGTNWRVSVTNTGQFIAQAIGKYNKILHFGNSILKHGIVSYWWGEWGMAAKTRSDDYAHRFLNKIRTVSPLAQSWELNIAAWEADPAGYPLSNLTPILTAQTYDLVVVRLGENATATPAATFKTAFRNLVSHIQTQAPTARVIIGGMFWVNGALDNAMREIAVEKNLTFSDMTGLDISANKSFIGDVVQGDDGQSHTVNNAGVANHPNNNGMEAIASRLFASANT